MSATQLTAALDKLDAAAFLASARGSLIFHLDLAAELARAALANAGISDAPLAVLASADGYEVVALAGTATSCIIAAVRFDNAGSAIVTRPNTPASARMEILAHARTTAAAGRDGARQAIIVVPPPRDAGETPIESYAITLAITPGAIALGPHSHLRLTPDGRRIIAVQPLFAETTELPPLPPPRRSHIALTQPGAVPSELHTYLSLKHAIDLAVTTPDPGLCWHVSGERTRRLA